MSRKGNSKAASAPTELNVNFRADRELADRFRAIVKQRELTLSGALRLYMSEVVKQAEDEQVAA